MKKHFFSSTVLLAAVAIFSILFFTQCASEASFSDCDGYTGPVTNKQAAALLAKCHFMPKDTITVWTDRYQKNKPTISGTPLPGASSVLGDSCSFNNSIVRAIITNDSCIGLRVVYGMDEANKVHIILVGIKPDYSTLYIRKPKDCGVGKNAAAKDGGGDGDDDLGGGEWADNP
jgi:hypothetical protein